MKKMAVSYGPVWGGRKKTQTRRTDLYGIWVALVGHIQTYIDVYRCTVIAPKVFGYIAANRAK